jgi:hypothetical protein
VADVLCAAVVCACSKGYVWCFVIPNKAVIAHDIQHRAQSGRYGRLVTPDISDKQENVSCMIDK